MSNAVLSDGRKEAGGNKSYLANASVMRHLCYRLLSEESLIKGEVTFSTAVISVILFYSCARNGHTGCKEEAGERFSAWIGDKDHYIPPNLRNLVYRYGMGERGDSAAWDEVLRRFVVEENPAEKRKLLYGLGTVVTGGPKT